MTRRFACRFALALALLAIPACGGEEGYRFDVHPADGTVTREDKPVAGAIVRFHPVDPSIVKVPEGQTGPAVMLTTETDDQGKFAMSTYVADDGVPAGEYRVTVQTSENETDLENSDGDYKKSEPIVAESEDGNEEGITRSQSRRKTRKTADPIAVYRNPKTTPLTATVKPGDNHFKFEMK